MERDLVPLNVPTSRWTADPWRGRHRPPRTWQGTCQGHLLRTLDQEIERPPRAMDLVAFLERSARSANRRSPQHHCEIFGRFGRGVRQDAYRQSRRF